MNPIGNLTTNQSIFNAIESSRQYKDAQFYSNLSRLIDVVHLSLVTTILFVGVWSNAIAIVVLTDRTFASVHYVPYKVLAVLEALFCMNQLVTNIMLLLIEDRFPDEDSYLLMYYTVFISRFVLSGVTYSAIYLTLVMTVDRYIAVCYPQYYHRHIASVSTSKVGILVSLLTTLGFALNSWSALVTYKIVPLEFVDGNGNNHSRLHLDKNDEYYSEVIVKDYYNMTIKASVVFAQFAMAAQILTKLYQQRRRFHSISTSNGTTTARKAAANQRTNARRERSVIKFLLIVSFLGLLRELFSEGNRIVKLSLGSDKVDEWITECDLQGFILRILYLIGTTIAAIDRSFKLYLYLAISVQFRDALRDKLPQWCCFRHTPVSV